ncbi:hypothetical protein JXI42_09455 [bacterium]|nr:hypothetical protein [bacterium]
MIQLHVKCPHCGKSLMDDEREIDGYPCVKIGISHSEKNGMIYLSSLYGSYIKESDVMPPEGEVGKFSCTHCNTELTSTRVCERCGAPMVAMDLEGGGTVQVCSRVGCKRHLVEFEDLDHELKKFYDSYHIF